MVLGTLEKEIWPLSAMNSSEITILTTEIKMGKKEEKH